jgi:hypothetical protein
MNMAEKIRYPQIPTTVWWGVRSILQKTPGVTVDERLLGVQLGVQETAARQYIAELKAVGILNEENKATPLALKWRLDDTYTDAVAELIEMNYPEGLRHIAPPGDSDRQKIVNWFLREGLGQGSAGNRAATYLMIGSKEPNEAPSRGGSGRTGRIEIAKDLASEKTTAKAGPRTAKSARKDGERGSSHERGPRPALGTDIMPLNINIQIHISADAGSEQIESIFSAMRRYLYDAQNS